MIRSDIVLMIYYRWVFSWYRNLLCCYEVVWLSWTCGQWCSIVLGWRWIELCSRLVVFLDDCLLSDCLPFSNNLFLLIVLGSRFIGIHGSFGFYGSKLSILCSVLLFVSFYCLFLFIYLFIYIVIVTFGVRIGCFVGSFVGRMFHCFFIVLLMKSNQLVTNLCDFFFLFLVEVIWIHSLVCYQNNHIYDSNVFE